MELWAPARPAGSSTLLCPSGARSTAEDTGPTLGHRPSLFSPPGPACACPQLSHPLHATNILHALGSQADFSASLSCFLASEQCPMLLANWKNRPIFNAIFPARACSHGALPSHLFYPGDHAFADQSGWCPSTKLLALSVCNANRTFSSPGPAQCMLS